MITGSRQRLHAQCDEIDISLISILSIDDKMIKRVDHTKSLGLTIDAQLSSVVTFMRYAIKPLQPLGH